jgi:phosphohistidine phosphatase SixA
LTSLPLFDGVAARSRRPGAGQPVDDNLPLMEVPMSTSAEILAVLSLVGAVAMVSARVTVAQTTPGALVSSLKQGGYVLVMRHASSPRETPDKATAHPDNLKMERQLDEAGRAGATAMGTALRTLQIPVGDVLSSPTYRALETARLAQLPKAESHAELGDRGQSMQGVTEADGAWLRARAAQLPQGSNTIVVTHMPNISRAFPDWGQVADGETVVVGPDGKGGLRSLGRIKIEEWPQLR